MKRRLTGYTIVIPLHLSLGYPSDYVDQTALILAKNNVVIFFDFIHPSLWRQTINEIKRVIKQFVQLLRAEVGSKICFRPFSVFPTRNIPFIFKINRFLGLVQFRLFLWLKKKPVIIWGFDPIIENVIGKLGEKLRVYDCIDCLGEDEETKNLKELEKKLFKKIDIVAFNSSVLFQEKLSKNNQIKNKAVVTVCGCAYNLFQTKDNHTIPDDLKNLKGNLVILAGVFDYRLDVNLLNYVIDKNPKLTFIFIGPFLKDVDKDFFALLNKNNVFYLGKKKKEQLSYYYKNSNLGIIPYKTSLNFVKYSNPMKAYEYLASGIPVLSTEIEALKKYPKDIVYTTDNYGDFNRNLKSMLKNWTIQKKMIAQKIAKKNSWDNKVAKIEEFIILKIFPL